MSNYLLIKNKFDDRLNRQEEKVFYCLFQIINTEDSPEKKKNAKEKFEIISERVLKIDLNLKDP